MPDLLLELFSEEIPARMQARGADELRRLVTDALVEAGLVYEGAKAFATPRRLVLNVAGIPAASPDTREERKGPRVGAPDQAVQGFLKAAGLASIEEAQIQTDPKKGKFYVAVIEKHGRPAGEVIAEIVPDVIRRFPWPKSMRWGSGSLRWVRPLQSVLCVFGPETEDTDVVEFEVDGIRSGRVTRGHRFMAPDPFEVRRFEDYVHKLEEARVVLDAERRKEVIRADARTLAFAQGLDVVEDEALLDEVAGLVEWPVVLMGSFDEAFLEIPPEVVRLTIRNNQKCFVLRDPARGELTNRFVLVANIEAKDGGRQIVAGNERVIAARLSDARFFWDQDRKTTLEEHAARLADITFHEKLGSQGERVERIARLARELAPLVGADADVAERAARLAKADLVTGMVGEFPELQGVMGRYYALAEGQPPEIADAIRDHYRPAGQNDEVPSAPVSIAVALADKLDMLVGFWAIDEKPTGSKDPYALRRAALGVIRIVLENGKKLDLTRILIGHAERYHPRTDSVTVTFEVIDFLRDRLKVQLREDGSRHDLVDAVFGLGIQRDVQMPGMSNVRDIFLIVRRVEALGAFLDTEDGQSLLTAYRRAANILRIEEKKDGRSYAGAPDPARLSEPAEKALYERIAAVAAETDSALEAEDFAAAMSALARLRQPVDAFFDQVTVNAEDAGLRENRLRLLSLIRAAMDRVADFSKIGG